MFWSWRDRAAPRALAMFGLTGNEWISIYWKHTVVHKLHKFNIDKTAAILAVVDLFVLLVHLK